MTAPYLRLLFRACWAPIQHCGRTRRTVFRDDRAAEVELPVEASFQDIAALANMGKLMDPLDYNGKGGSAGSDVTIVVFDESGKIYE